MLNLTALTKTMRMHHGNQIFISTLMCWGLAVLDRMLCERTLESISVMNTN